MMTHLLEVLTGTKLSSSVACPLGLGGGGGGLGVPGGGNWGRGSQGLGAPRHLGLNRASRGGAFGCSPAGSCVSSSSACAASMSMFKLIIEFQTIPVVTITRCCIHDLRAVRHLQGQCMSILGAAEGRWND